MDKGFSYLELPFYFRGGKREVIKEIRLQGWVLQGKGEVMSESKKETNGKSSGVVREGFFEL